jgi:rhodanese-related sulfurtransferase/peroxiredoxin
VLFGKIRLKGDSIMGIIKKYIAVPFAFFLVFMLVAEPYSKAISVGDKAADFTLRTHDGKSLTLSKLKGKRGAVLVFFATWCPSCMAEVPQIKKFVDESKDKGILVYGVNLQQEQRIVDNFVKSYKVNYRILMDLQGEAGKKYGVRGIPYIVGIDANGIVKYADHHLPSDKGKFIKSLAEGIKKEVKKEVNKKDKMEAKNSKDYMKDGISFISKETLQKFQKEDKDLVVIDVLSPKSYARAHVKGSINIPLKELKGKMSTLSKEGKIVVYCANYKCHASTAAAKQLNAAGFKAVHDYKGGIKEWKEAGLPVGGSEKK